MNVDVIDLARVGGGHRPAKRVARNLLEEFFAFCGRDRFGIAHPGNVAAGIEHDGGGHHRAGETPPAHLVDASHIAKSDAA